MRHPRIGCYARRTGAGMAAARGVNGKRPAPSRVGALEHHAMTDPQALLIEALGSRRRLRCLYSGKRHLVGPQRYGARASRRLERGDGDDNAPASEASGTWVRVAAGVAGNNWGSVFTPRLGQEVLVQFVAGDIDRAVVVGCSLYNGQGSVDAQGNQLGGAAVNTGLLFPNSAGVDFPTL